MGNSSWIDTLLQSARLAASIGLAFRASGDKIKGK
jgi:hypothetical protein